eukprot:COSAG04_NODE_26047_length_300_cov_0.766169_1_plen_28_part_10
MPRKIENQRFDEHVLVKSLIFNFLINEW